MFNKKKNKKKGFTLIELLVIVIIIGVLTAIAVPLYFSAVEKTRASEALHLLGTIAKSQQRYKLQSQEYSDNMDNLDITVRDYTTGEDATGSEFASQYFDFNLIVDGATSSRKDGDYILGVDYNTNAIYCGGNDTSICYKLGITDIREISSGSSGLDYVPYIGYSEFVTN